MRTSRKIYMALCTLYLVLCTACNPEAQWETKDVVITITPKIASAGYIECAFSTNKPAYYLIACEEARAGYDPMANQKQFMTIALDSANMAYLHWRNALLEDGEYFIAPFASHALHYGTVNHFFTNLKPSTEYWVYAFVVNPEKKEPAGNLYLIPVSTIDSSLENVHFEYRIRGTWDYIYPLNPDGKINSHFPYMACTRDSAELTELYGQGPEDYFTEYFVGIAAADLVEDNVLYGVRVKNNDGWDSDVEFIEGHTYYTAIVSFDGFIGNNVIYRFTWKGDKYEAYFKDEDSIVDNGENS